MEKKRNAGRRFSGKSGKWICRTSLGNEIRQVKWEASYRQIMIDHLWNGRNPQKLLGKCLIGSLLC
ncbi:hypothetical protein [Fundicoccus culcitae]|uniref:Uncharacterized protein n=1 Tax=Fundicoccus culcitae TaxID=2969821 RepID=A0ABY5PA50_9LACT|nr:hypothetical protein [Fundicoccus culcitae]UUX35265.1 hypothetical protein NRE15_06370 [Fundicoccus culcitae]